MTSESGDGDRWSRKHAEVADGFFAYKVPGVQVSKPRSIVIHRDDSTSSLDRALVLERGTNSVLLLQWNSSLPLRNVEETPLVSVDGLNHGLAWSESHIYASTATSVYRWEFQPNSDGSWALGEMESIVNNIHADGKGGAPLGHTTRTLAIREEYLYISVGSYANIDETSYRSRIRRFLLSGNQTFPLDFRDGEVYADGLRNEVAMEFDSNRVLWGVGNSGDNLFRTDLGGDIHNDNPAEEVHRLGPDEHYGYPFCWREYNLPKGLGRGTAWAWPSTMDVVTDQDCREQYDAPVATLPAHSAPLGITFYRYNESRRCEGVIPFPKELDGFAFVAYHGSWNRDIPTGYKVVYMNLQSADASDPVDLIRSKGCYAKWNDRTRPVDVSFDSCGRLWITSDGSRGRGSHLIIVESSSETLLPQPPMEIPCAWQLPGWAIALISIFAAFVLASVTWFCWRRKRYQKARTSENETNF